MSSEPKNLNNDMKDVLLNNTNSYMKPFDEDLINPYSHILNKNEQKVNQSKNLFDTFPKNEEKLPIFPLNINGKNEKIQENMNKTIIQKGDNEEGIDIFNKFDDINNIIKNETIKTLKNIHHFSEDNNKTSYNNETTKMNNTKIVNLGTFSPFEMLKFKQNNYAEVVNNVKGNGKDRKISKDNSFRHMKKRYESTKKMFENIDHQQMYESKLNHNAKLFLNHFKENIDKIEDIVNKK